MFTPQPSAPTTGFLSQALTNDDGSTNDARLASVVISASAASGDYPYGTLWCQV